MSPNGSIDLLLKYQSKYAYIWKVNNFSAICAVGNNIDSKKFTTHGGEDGSYCWYLHLYRYKSEDREYLSLSLMSSNELPIGTEYSLIILDDRNEVAKKFIKKKQPTSTKLGLAKRKFKIQFTAKFDLTESEDKGQRLLTNNDTLRIVCEISHVKKIENFESILQEPSHTNELNALGHFEKLLNDQKFSDVEFTVAKQTLYAHKAVLSRSPVFSAMFEHDMCENKENKVIITDAEYDVFKEMLRFIYCGKVQAIDKVAAQLLPVADKYALTDLKSMCENSLCDNLSMDNVLEMLKFADLYNAVILKEEVKVFMIAHARDLVQLPEFKTLKNLEDNLFTEVMQALIVKEK